MSEKREKMKVVATAFLFKKKEMPIEEAWGLRIQFIDQKTGKIDNTRPALVLWNSHIKAVQLSGVGMPVHELPVREQTTTF